MAGYLKPEDIQVVNNELALSAMVRELRDSRIIAFDLETDGPDKEARVDPLRSEIGSFQFATEDSNFYVPAPVRGGSMPLPEILEAISPVFTYQQLTILGHNLKFDIKHYLMSVSRNMGKRAIFRCRFIDTLVADWILDENDRKHSLDHCAKKHLGIKMIKFKDAEEAGDLSDLRIRYGCDDVRVPWKLWHEVYHPSIQEQGLSKVFHELEMEFIYSIIEMELNGLRVDSERLRTLQVAYEGDMDGLQAEIYQLAGQKFLLTSPAQLSRVLFDSMGFEPKPDMERNKTGNWPTGREVLEKYEGEHEIFDKLLRWRKVSRLKTGFVSPLLEFAKFDGRVRATFNQVGTVTGRLSSKAPNLQNIPRAKDSIRNAFVADEGRTIVCADFSQLELRLMAHFSQDPTLLTAYTKEGADVHQITADECGCSRQEAKVINFGLIYGMSPGLLSRVLKIPYEDAEKYHANYFQVYTGVKDFHQKIWNTLDRQGYVVTLTKRRRRFPEWEHLDRRDRSQWYRMLQLHRQAVNVVIQGSGADIVKISQRNFQRRVREEALDEVVYQCSQVHDEMIAECPLDIGDMVLEMVIHEMENSVKLRVPLISEGAHRPSWGEAKAAA